MDEVRKLGYKLSKLGVRLNVGDGSRACLAHRAAEQPQGLVPHPGDLYTESGQTLQGSFSAVSKPNFASKYSLESSRRDLHNALLCTVL